MKEVKQKNYCYKSECSVVKAGFQFCEWLVCPKCREELTPQFAKTIEERKKNYDLDIIDYMDPYINYHDPMGE